MKQRQFITHFLLFSATITAFTAYEIENILETEDLNFVSGGSWDNERECHSGSFITGYGFKFNSEGNIATITFQCSYLGPENRFVPDHNITVGFPEDSANVPANKVFYYGGTYAVGYSSQLWNDSFGDYYIGGRQLLFEGQVEPFLAFPPNAQYRQISESVCTAGYGLCSVKARLKRRVMDHPGHVTRLMFRCCYFCVPQEGEEIVWNFVNNKTEPTRYTTRRTSGSSMDSALSQAGSLGRSFENSNDGSLTHFQNTNSGSTESSTDSYDTRTGKSVVVNESNSTRLSNGTQVGGVLGISNRNSTTENEQENKGTSSSKDKSDTASANENVGTGTTDTKSNSEQDTRGSSSGVTTSVSKSHTEGTSNRFSASSTFGWSASAEGGIQGIATVKGGSHADFTIGYERGWHSEDTSTTGQSVESRDHWERGVTKGTSEEVSRRLDINKMNQYQNSIREEKNQGSSKGVGTEATVDLSNTTSNNINFGIDTGKDFGITKSITKDESRQRALHRALEKSIQQGAQKMFSKRFANSIWSDKSRTQSWSRMWNEQWEETFEYVCEKHSVCEVKQTSGKCGAIVIRVPTIVASSRSLHDISIPVTKFRSEKNRLEQYFESEYPRQTWIVVAGMSFFEASTSDDDWEPAVTCAEGSIVIGHSQKMVRGLALTGIKLLCSATKDRIRHSFKPYYIMSEVSPRGNWTKEEKHGPSDWATGYQFMTGALKGVEILGSHTFVYHNTWSKSLPDWPENKQIRAASCPDHHAVCGVQIKRDRNGRGAIAAMGLKCCFHCIHSEKEDTLLSMSNNSPSESPLELTFRYGTNNDTTISQSKSSSTRLWMDVNGLRQGFTTSLSNISDSAFDWNKATHSFWSSEQEKRITTYCSPRHLCEFKQVVGTCGPFDVPTPVIRFSETPIYDDPDFNLVTFRGDSEVRVYDGQMFIEMPTTESQFNASGGGEWRSVQECDMGSAIIGGRITTAGKGGILTGIEVLCGHIAPLRKEKRQRMGYQKDSRALSIDYLRTEQEYKMMLSTDEEGQKPAVGFLVVLSDDGKYEYDLIFERNSPSEDGLTRTCPPSYALCGIQAFIPPDYDQISTIRFKCCLHCLPEEAKHYLQGHINKQRQDNILPLDFRTGLSSPWSHDLDRRMNESGLVLDKNEDIRTLRTLFVKRFQHYSPFKFNWTHVPDSIWEGVSHVRKELKCPGRHYCDFSQLVGKCGELTVKMAYTVADEKEIG